MVFPHTHTTDPTEAQHAAPYPFLGVDGGLGEDMAVVVRGGRVAVRMEEEVASKTLGQVRGGGVRGMGGELSTVCGGGGVLDKMGGGGEAAKGCGDWAVAKGAEVRLRGGVVARTAADDVDVDRLSFRLLSGMHHTTCGSIIYSKDISKA